MKLKERLFSYHNPKSLVNKARRKRFEHFQKCLSNLPIQRTISILDIGGTYSYWESVGLLDPGRYQITLLNLNRSRLPDQTNGFISDEGDARSEKINLAQYDVIFSNSVIEHLGSFEAMKQLADRIRSSSKPYYLQTPSRWFPLEPHCHIPFFQFLPRKLRAWLIWHFRINYFPRGHNYQDCLHVSDSTILLYKKQIQRLFPEADIMVEQLAGLPKSYTAFAGFINP